jgi:hypothetical protein
MRTCFELLQENTNQCCQFQSEKVQVKINIFEIMQQEVKTTKKDKLLKSFKVSLKLFKNFPPTEIHQTLKSFN